jgi:hypothetical protein
MVVYQVFLRDAGNRSELIGIFPERRTSKERINLESILKWSELIFGNTVDCQNLFVVRSTI